MQSLNRAITVLRVFEDDTRVLRLSEIVERTGLSKSTTHRICSTLVDGGLMLRVSERKYRIAIRPITRKRYRIGFGVQNASDDFSRQVVESLERSAASADVELMILDNEDSVQRALKNAQLFADEKVDLVIESQTEVGAAGRIAETLRSAKIPAIALEIPQPGAIFFGANNVEAGLLAGRFLAQWCEANWSGTMDQILLLDLPKAGSIPNSRIQASLLGVVEKAAWLTEDQIHTLHTVGTFDSAHTMVRRYLSKTSRSRKVLVVTINDTTALGLLQAFRDAGREEHCAIVCHNGSSEVLTEIAKPSSRLVGAVAYYPERYGDHVIPLAIRMLNDQPVRRLNFMKHEMINQLNASTYNARVKFH